MARFDLVKFGTKRKTPQHHQLELGFETMLNSTLGRDKFNGQIKNNHLYKWGFILKSIVSKRRVLHLFICCLNFLNPTDMDSWWEIQLQNMPILRNMISSFRFLVEEKVEAPSWMISMVVGHNSFKSRYKTRVHIDKWTSRDSNSLHLSSSKVKFD